MLCGLQQDTPNVFPLCGNDYVVWWNLHLAARWPCSTFSRFRWEEKKILRALLGLQSRYLPGRHFEGINENCLQNNDSKWNGGSFQRGARTNNFGLTNDSTTCQVLFLAGSLFLSVVSWPTLRGITRLRYFCCFLAYFPRVKRNTICNFLELWKP